MDGAAKRRWSIHPCNTELARRLSDGLRIHPVVGRLLVNRGVQTTEEGHTYLDRRLNNLRDPALLPGASSAADLIHQAVREHKQICIFGDYDVDGMCASAILIECLRLGGVQPRFYVPDRFDEGYGVNAQALRRLRDDGVDVIVTVDCGITSAKEAELARELGLVYIVTDHHQLTEELPQADAVVHPGLPECDYPFEGLCGTGVAFKVAWETARRFSGSTKTTTRFQKFLLDATSLAAIGTVADVVPLLDENRILVHHGLLSLKRSPPLGLRLLMEQANLHQKQQLASDDIAFVLGPRLNACGRLGQARLGVELLTTADEARAAELARYLDEENKNRQTIERRIYTEAKQMAQAEYDLDDPAAATAMVLASDDWHPGVIGIVAGRMATRFHRPCLLIALGEHKGTGSGRSIPGFDLHRALLDCSEHLQTAGGHAMAAGLRVERDKLPAFREQFHEYSAPRLAAGDLTAELHVDLEVPLHLLTPALINALEVMAPFGQSNPPPLMLATDLEVVGQPRCVGGGNRHLSFRVRQGDRTVRKAIAFGMAERANELIEQESKCCVVFSPMINTYRGYPEVELLVKDFRPGSRVVNEVSTACPTT